jgi:predicted RNA-binding Zn-ribbon protein involved in translation (DUF1610 family)
MYPNEQVQNDDENEKDCPDCGHPLNWYESILQWLCPDCDSDFIDSQEEPVATVHFDYHDDDGDDELYPGEYRGHR